MPGNNQFVGQALTALTENTVLAPTDLFLLTTDPGGAPASVTISASNAFSFRRYQEFETLNTSFTISDSQYQKWLEVSNAITITLPAALSEGFECIVDNTGTDTISFSAGVGATIAPSAFGTDITQQGRRVHLVKKPSDVWAISGAG